MRKIWAKYVLAIGVGTLAMFSQGCKRQVAPAQTGGAVVPRARPEPSFAPLPFEAPVDTVEQPSQVSHRHRAPAPQVASAPVVRQPVEVDVVALQGRQDAKLLQQQEAASQRQQQELNVEVEQSQKAQDEEQNEPRIQDAPGPTPGSGIQDAPTLAPHQGIQDAPGPAQTLPQPQTAPEPQTAPQV